MGSIKHPKPFTVLIAGAGIAGLSTAIALARQGLDVTVLEGKPELTEFGASIGIHPYAVRVIQSYGLEEQFKAHVTENTFVDIRDGKDNKVLGAMVQNEKDTSKIRYGAPAWNIHRADYQQLLADGARRHGARILYNADVAQVDVDTNTINLKDGRTLTADLIVGADGLRSVVRASIPATASAELRPSDERAYRCTVDKKVMSSNPNLTWLLEAGTSQFWAMPGKYILAWPLPPDRPYDVVVCFSGGCDVPFGYWGIQADPKEVAHGFRDACETVKDLLANIGPCIQWRLAELPHLDTFRSETGGTVLVGDAAHAMLPHAGSGGSTAIEDGAILAECVAWAYNNGRTIAEATRAYDDLQKPRAHRIQSASQEGVGFLNGEHAEARNAMLAKLLDAMKADLARPQEERRAEVQPPGDANAPWPSPPYLQWLETYDAVKEAQAFLAKR